MRVAMAAASGPAAWADSAILACTTHAHPLHRHRHYSCHLHLPLAGHSHPSCPPAARSTCTRRPCLPACPCPRHRRHSTDHTRPGPDHPAGHIPCLHPSHRLRYTGHHHCVRHSRRPCLRHAYPPLACWPRGRAPRPCRTQGRTGRSQRRRDGTQTAASDPGPERTASLPCSVADGRRSC